MTTSESASSAEALWGARAIANFLGLSERQVFNKIYHNGLPAKQVGRRWVATKAALVHWLNEIER